MSINKDVNKVNENKDRINWYPGHMAKTKRLLQDQIKRIDLIIELCDARLPYSSRNPELSSMIAQKRHLLFMNKSDLADPGMNKRWLQYYRRQGIEAHLTNASMMKGKETVSLIEEATKDMKGVKVDSTSGLSVTYAKEHGATCLIRGLRAVTDFEYEFTLAASNEFIDDSIDMVFFMSHAETSFISSSSIDELYRSGVDISKLVPPSVIKMYKKK